MPGAAAAAALPLHLAGEVIFCEASDSAWRLGADPSVACSLCPARDAALEGSLAELRRLGGFPGQAPSPPALASPPRAAASAAAWAGAAGSLDAVKRLLDAAAQCGGARAEREPGHDRLCSPGYDAARCCRQARPPPPPPPPAPRAARRAASPTRAPRRAPQCLYAFLVARVEVWSKHAVGEQVRVALRRHPFAAPIPRRARAPAPAVSRAALAPNAAFWVALR